MDRILNKAEYPALDASRRRLREGVTDLRTDLRTDRRSYRDARTHLKMQTVTHCHVYAVRYYFLLLSCFPISVGTESQMIV